MPINTSTYTVSTATYNSLTPFLTTGTSTINGATFYLQDVNGIIYSNSGTFYGVAGTPIIFS